MIKISIILLRLLTLPFLIGILIIAYTYNLFKSCYYFLIHGGEFITYNEKNQRKSIEDIYNQLYNINNKNLKLWDGEQISQ